MDMTPQRWANTTAYLDDVFGEQDEHLAGLMQRAVEAGLPDIAVSPDVGRLLKLLTTLSGGLSGGSLALELGTLAGYSGIWIARGLAPGGRLITVEPEPAHAAFARQAFDEAGVGTMVEVVERPALDIMPALLDKHGHGSFDLVFLDAIKDEYPDYLEHARPMLRPGGLLVADNTLGAGDWWIDDEPGRSADRDAMDRFNRAVAADPAFEAACVPLRQGLVIARRNA